MRTYVYGRDDAPALDCCVIALGFFDGVHIAHRELIRKARDEAKKLGAPSAVFTFFSGDDMKGCQRRIYGDREKLMIFEELGVDVCIVAKLSDIADMSAEEFVSHVLLKYAKAKCAVCGYNFRFGRGASGGAEDLCRIMSSQGQSALVIKEMTYGNEPISSTRIRQCISDGRIREANEMLGAPYFFCGEVTHGRGEGRTLGFPTVNTELPVTRQIPKFGVYKTEIPIDGKIRLGLTNIGTCPTFGERSAHLETFVLDYEGDLYGRQLDIRLIDFIREEKHFRTKEELIMQINIDKSIILEKQKEG